MSLMSRRAFAPALLVAAAAALPASASATAHLTLRSFGANTALACLGTDGGGGGLVDFGISGRVLESAWHGDAVSLSGMKLAFDSGDGSLARGTRQFGNSFTVTLESLEFGVTNTDVSTVQLPGATSSVVTIPPVIPQYHDDRPLGWSLPSTTGAELGATNKGIVTGAIGSSVDFSVSQVVLTVNYYASSDGTGDATPRTLTCKPTVGSFPVVSIPVVDGRGGGYPGPTTPIAPPATTPTAPPATTPIPPATTPATTPVAPTTPTAPAALPSVGLVLGQGYGFVGGLIVVGGSHFDGYTGLTVGGKKAITLGRLGNFVIAIAPAQAPGSYPVVVTTKSGVSPAAAAAKYKYTSLF